MHWPCVCAASNEKLGDGLRTVRQYSAYKVKNSIRHWNLCPALCCTTGPLHFQFGSYTYVPQRYPSPISIYWLVIFSQKQWASRTTRSIIFYNCVETLDVLWCSLSDNLRCVVPASTWVCLLHTYYSIAVLAVTCVLFSLLWNRSGIP